MIQIHCPTTERGIDDIVGCGSANVVWDAREKLYDCLECGIWFNPQLEDPEDIGLGKMTAEEKRKWLAHAALVTACEEAIESLFSDTTVSREKTADDLRCLVDGLLLKLHTLE